MFGWGVLVCACAAAGAAQESSTHSQQDNHVEPAEAELAGTDLIKIFGIFRHGDRTPDLDEVIMYPERDMGEDMFFPYGMKALTNEGKRRGYEVGRFLRRRYAKFASALYLPEELALRCTDYDRTKMTALTAMAALYPPERYQLWNPGLAWQPVPYDLRPRKTCDLLYWYNCPPYLKNRNKVYDVPEVAEMIRQYTDLFDLLTNRTGYKYRTTEDVFYLDNLMQAQQNVGYMPPEWMDEEVMRRIKEVTKLEYLTQYYNKKLISISFGVMLGEILKSAEQTVTGVSMHPKLTLVSAHENNVGAMMAAVGVFYPHQPNYGATFVLELRKISSTGKYAFTAAYSPVAGGPAHLLPIAGCGGGLLCDYETFVDLTSDVVLTPDQYRTICAAPDL